MMTLDAVECPACGCNASEVIETLTSWGKPVERRECDHCHKRFVVDAEPPPPPDLSSVKYPVLRCPKCGSKNVSTSKVLKDIGLRRHKCQEPDCRHPFKSVE
ncbi:MAG: hypothetical protein E6Q97_10035 [Desulfurellales bacterium]|nr:MAG: hypothetical protein E6Q97_10035 [Desulfurellales bacterium]